MEALTPTVHPGEFSVFWWDPSDIYHLEKSRCSALEAVEMAHSLTQRPAARMGIIRRVMITDGGDCCCFEWKDGAIVFDGKTLAG